MLGGARCAVAAAQRFACAARTRGPCRRRRRRRRRASRPPVPLLLLLLRLARRRRQQPQPPGLRLERGREARAARRLGGRRQGREVDQLGRDHVQRGSFRGEVGRPLRRLPLLPLLPGRAAPAAVVAARRSQGGSLALAPASLLDCAPALLLPAQPRRADGRLAPRVRLVLGPRHVRLVPAPHQPRALGHPGAVATAQPLAARAARRLAAAAAVALDPDAAGVRQRRRVALRVGARLHARLCIRRHARRRLRRHPELPASPSTPALALALIDLKTQTSRGCGFV